MIRRLTLTTVALVLTALPALSQQPQRQAQTSTEVPAWPEWDRRAHCERSNRMMATESAAILRLCLDQEDRAAALLQRSWDAAPAAAKRTCINQQRAMRMSSYSLLNLCMEMEADATRDLQQRPR